MWRISVLNCGKADGIFRLVYTSTSFICLGGSFNSSRWSCSFCKGNAAAGSRCRCHMGLQLREIPQAKLTKFDAILKLRPERKQTQLAWINKIRWWSECVWWNLFVFMHRCDIAGWWTGQSSCKGSCCGGKEGGLWREISLKGTLVWPASSTFLEIQAAQAVFLTESLGRNFIFLSSNILKCPNVSSRLKKWGSNPTMRHLQVLSRLAWRQGFQSNRPGLRQSGEAVQVDVILFVNRLEGRVCGHGCNAWFPQFKRERCQRFAPRLLRTQYDAIIVVKYPLSGKGAGNADFGDLTEALEHSKPHRVRFARMHMCDLGPDMMIQDSSSKDSNLFSQSLFGTLTSVFAFIIAKKSYVIWSHERWSAQLILCHTKWGSLAVNFWSSCFRLWPWWVAISAGKVPFWMVSFQPPSNRSAASDASKGMKSHGDYRVYSGDQESGKAGVWMLVQISFVVLALTMLNLDTFRCGCEIAWLDRIKTGDACELWPWIKMGYIESGAIAMYGFLSQERLHSSDSD